MSIWAKNPIIQINISILIYRILFTSNEIINNKYPLKSVVVGAGTAFNEADSCNLKISGNIIATGRQNLNSKGITELSLSLPTDRIPHNLEIVMSVGDWCVKLDDLIVTGY